MAFNRPWLLRRTLEALRQAAPSAVFISIDGPRHGVQGDQDLVRESAEVAAHHEFDCPVSIRQLATNGGLGVGVNDAITWFFEHEERGVILEDDVCIAPGSLELMSDLLERFRGDESVGSVTLFNPVPPSRMSDPKATFRFSALPSSQYWGTWSNRWDARVRSLDHWGELVGSTLEDAGGAAFAREMRRQLDLESQTGHPSWEYLWLVTHWARGWKSVNANLNASKHIGFGTGASNSTEQPSWYPTEFDTWDGQVRPPSSSGVDRKADQWLFNQRFALSWVKRAKAHIGKRLPWLRRAWRDRRIAQIDYT